MEPIKRISLTDEVVTSIKEMINSGEYAVGQKIPSDTQLCKQLDVSRPTLREAIKVLSAMGYINLIVGKGAFVADHLNKGNKNEFKRISDIQNFKDFMQVRLALEPAAMALAVPNITAQQVDSLEKIHSAFVHASNEKDIPKLMMLDETFHAQIIQCSGNKIMVDIIKSLNNNIRQFRADSFADPFIYQNSLHPHEEILFYIKQKNSEKSVAALRTHLINVQTDIMQMLEKDQ